MANMTDIGNTIGNINGATGVQPTTQLIAQVFTPRTLHEKSTIIDRLNLKFAGQDVDIETYQDKEKRSYEFPTDAAIKEARDASLKFLKR